MSSRRYRPISEEIAAPTSSATASTVSNANVVRVVNASTTAYLVTVISDAGVTIGSMTLVGGESVFVDKPKSYKIFAANASVKLTSVSYPA